MGWVRYSPLSIVLLDVDVSAAQTCATLYNLADGSAVLVKDPKNQKGMALALLPVFFFVDSYCLSASFACPFLPVAVPLTLLFSPPAASCKLLTTSPQISKVY